MSRWLFALLGVLVAISARGQGLSVVDARGHVLQINQPVTRIVALAPHFVENLHAIGAGELLVGALGGMEVPGQRADLPSVGSHAGINAEAVLALRPDLVLAWLSGNGEAVVRRLEGLGLTVLTEEPRDIEDIAASLRQLGRIAGREAAAERVAERFLSELADLTRTYAAARPVRVFYQIWHEPLQTLNGEHLVSRLIELCGGRNVFYDAPVLAPRVSLEAVIAAKPELIVGGGSGADDGAQLAIWRRWTAIPAVATGHVYGIDPDPIQRFTPRMVKGARTLCGLIERARMPAAIEDPDHAQH